MKTCERYVYDLTGSAQEEILRVAVVQIANKENPVPRRMKESDLPAAGDKSAGAIGKRIRFAREARGLTVARLAAEMGVSPEQIRELERGEFDVAAFFGVSTPFPIGINGKSPKA